MHILCPISLLLIFCSILELHKRVVEHFLGFLSMDCVTSFNSYLKHLSGNFDFGCGLLVFGNLKQIFQILAVFLLFGFGLKVLNFSWFFKRLNGLLFDFGGKSGVLRDGIYAKNDLGGKCCSKISSCNRRFMKILNNLSPPVTGKLEETEFMNCDAVAYCKSTDGFNEECNDDDDDDDDDEKPQNYDEDNEFGALALRKLIKIERRRAKSALLELEKERLSAATAAEESMAMILRLQNEKSLIDMEYKQYKRVVEEKLLYDQELIQSLQWLVMHHESDNTVQLSQKKLILPMKSCEMDQCEEVEESFSTSNEGTFDGCLFRSLDLDASRDYFFEPTFSSCLI